MPQRISPREFHQTPGVEDWRVVFEGARTYYATGSFAKGVELVRRIGELADAASHHPNVDLRYGGVAVTLNTHELGGDISERDAALAAQISRAARELGVPADPARVQTVQIAIDALVIPDVLPFWKAVLGYDQLGDEDAVDPFGRTPNVWFQQMHAPRPGRGRIHVDVSLPADQVEARIAAGLAAGGRVVNDSFAPQWWTLADSEGNEVDLAPWRDQADSDQGDGDRGDSDQAG